MIQLSCYIFKNQILAHSESVVFKQKKYYVLNKLRKNKNSTQILSLGLI